MTRECAHSAATPHFVLHFGPPLCPIPTLASSRFKCGCPERFAQQALGHNSKAVHHACSKHAEVTVPCLDDWDKQWKKNAQGMEKPKVVAVDFQAQDSRSEVKTPSPLATAT